MHMQRARIVPSVSFPIGQGFDVRAMRPTPPQSHVYTRVCTCDVLIEGKEHGRGRQWHMMTGAIINTLSTRLLM